jgi:hypothetical protein
MRTIPLLVASILLASSTSSLTIDHRNFDEHVANSDEVWILLFCNQARRVCKNFAPAWSGFSASLKRARWGNVDVGTTSGRALGERLGFSMAHLPAVASFKDSTDPEMYTIMGDGEDMTTKLLRRKMKKLAKGLAKGSNGMYLKVGKKTKRPKKQSAKVAVEVGTMGSAAEVDSGVEDAEDPVTDALWADDDEDEADAEPREEDEPVADVLWGKLRRGTARGSKLARGFKEAGR